MPVLYQPGWGLARACSVRAVVPMRQQAVVAQAHAPQKAQTVTCRRCKQQFRREDNHAGACRFHTAIYTGGEVSKAIGFCRASSAPEDQLIAVVGRTGLIRFWDCCGSEDPDAPGCCTGFHRGYDDPEDD